MQPAPWVVRFVGTMRSETPIDSVTAGAYTIPTDAPESDGTLAWDSTTLVLAEIEAAGRKGLGYTYCDAVAAEFIRTRLAKVLQGRAAFAIEEAWTAMAVAVRNIGRPGLVACAISALDLALWDLKARLLDLPLSTLLGRARDRVCVYGSGGFTSYDDRQIADQLTGWAGQGCAAVKMKVGREPGRDLARVDVARNAIGSGVELFVDANGAYGRKEALKFAKEFAERGAVWFEEPVSSDDLAGLQLIRDNGPSGMDIAAGEYGYTPFYFRQMLEAGAVDVLQADATRCGGATGFMRAAALCDAFSVPLSSHCAPAAHVAVAATAPRLLHMEWFHDHVRIEEMLFDGAPRVLHGFIAPDLSRPGNGLAFRRADAERFKTR
jgi:L-alanine-DL-glutamate epimerase-like enolase superfamily enzyme